MTLTTFIQIFIILDVLIIGLLAPVLYRHAKAHFKPDQHAEPPAGDAKLPEEVKEHLLKDSEDKFEATVNHSITQLQHNLQNTNDDINNLIKKMAVELVSGELENYRTDLLKLHEQAEKELGNFKQTMDGHEAELQAKMAQEMEIEKQRLIKQIDTKLGDAVGSFLLEALGHNVDLGSQSTYLISLLEAHKADFIKEVSDGDPVKPA